MEQNNGSGEVGGNQPAVFVIIMFGHFFATQLLFLWLLIIRLVVHIERGLNARETNQETETMMAKRACKVKPWR